MRALRSKPNLQDTTALHHVLRKPAMSVWSWILGSIWKQPLKPHHALELEPEGLVAAVSAAPAKPLDPPRARCEMLPTPTPDCASSALSPPHLAAPSTGTSTRLASCRACASTRSIA